MMYYYGNFFPFDWLGFGLMPVLMILFWGLVVYGVVLLFRGFSNKDNNNRSIDIIKERYAKGDITKEQFESMKKDLG
ncbi:MAG: putative membrane protein [Parcubacteria group bacterium LiPW_30]|nr:MAG: putative membrane protein [Parcubacteria group bacterium LiPW_30]